MNNTTQHMNDNVTKSIDIHTLRTLLPLWARAAGFTVHTKEGDDSIIAVETDKECPVRHAAAWFARTAAGLTVTDGELLYGVKDGFVYVKMQRHGDEGDKH